MSKTKNNTALGGDYGVKMKSIYTKKVKTSAKIYSKEDRRDNHIVQNLIEEVQKKLQKGNSSHGSCLCGAVCFNIKYELRQVVN